MTGWRIHVWVLIGQSLSKRQGAEASKYLNLKLERAFV